MRVLVTGGAGYVGGVSVERLVEAGHHVVVLDDLSTGHPAIVAPAARLVTGSYDDVTLVGGLLAADGIEAILHCGAKSLVPESVAEPARYYRANVAGGIALLEAARGAGVTRFVFSSTAAVYGVPASTPIVEDAPLLPINPYGETKRALEAALRAYADAYGFRVAILRYFNVAGASKRVGEVHRPETHLVPNVLLAAEGGPALTLFGGDYPTPDGTPVRDYIHVADLADAHLAALEATAPGDPRISAGGDGGPGPLVCNLGSARGFSVRELLAAAEAVVGAPIPHVVGPRRAGDPPVLVASNERALAVLGWTPRRSTLPEMLGSAWRWRRANPAGYDA